MAAIPELINSRTPSAVKSVDARRQALETLQQIIGITTQVFQVPVLVNESFDPEYPDEKFIVFTAEVDGDNSAILEREAEWRRRMADITPQWDDFRLLVKRKK